MKIVFIGDCKFDTGPSNVNKNFRRHLSGRMHFLKREKKAARAVETVAAVLKSETVIISGLSVINGLALYTAKFNGKPVIYLMHGSCVYEAEINRYELKKPAEKLERAMLSYAKKVIAVSELYMDWAQKYFPEYREKFTYINNGIEWSVYEKIKAGSKERNPYMILAMGGGRPQKNNLVICDAVRILNEKYHRPFELVVLGQDGADTDAIKKSPYTQYVGQVPGNDVKKWLAKASIYIQNSSFEPFGLAVMEALCSGCDLLISKQVGAVSVMNTVEEADLIEDCKNPEEIAGKIMNVSANGNQERLWSGIDRETTSCEFAGRKLLDIAESIGFAQVAQRGV